MSPAEDFSYFNQPAPTYPKPHYTYTIAPFFAGQVYDLFRRETDTVSCDTELDFGVAICDTNKFYKVELPSATNTNFSGVTQHEHLDPYLTNGRVIFPPKYPIPRLKNGHVVIRLDTDVFSLSPQDPVFVRTVARGENKLGWFRNNSDGGNAALWSAAKWFRPPDNGLAVIAIEVP